MKKDEAGNLVFTHDNVEYRIPNFNWRLQRDIVAKLVTVQTADGGTMLYGDSATKVQDYIFSITTVLASPGKYVFLTQTEQDARFKSYADAVNLYTAILEAIMPFLDESGESPQAKPVLVPKAQSTAPKRKTILD